MPELEKLQIDTTSYFLRDSAATKRIQTITYARLKELRDTNKLVPGQQYAIEDYDCTTTQVGTQSAGHKFAIIVTADTPSVLNENARADTLHLNTSTVEVNDITTEIEVFAVQYTDNALNANYKIGEYQDTIMGFDATTNRLFYDIYGDYLEYVDRFPFNGYLYGRWKRIDLTDVADDNMGDVYVIMNAFIFDGKLKRTANDYFAKCNLNAWQLKYCLDNDNTRFAWADTKNGKGVIYYMKDEFGNEAPYDFKNIQFLRYSCILNVDEVPAGFEDTVFNNVAFPGCNYWATVTHTPSIFTRDTANSIYVYTFHDLISNTDSTVDVYNNRTSGFAADYGYPMRCYNNVIKPYTVVTNLGSGDDNRQTLRLNDIVFYNRIHDDEVAPPICGNVFGINCHDMTFAKKCQNNTFGNDCFNNIFSGSCQENIFDNLCKENILGYYCKSNKFGNNCSGNILANWCDDNIFGNMCTGNTLDENCSSNTFDNACKTNTLDYNCSFNSFGKSCSNNGLKPRCNYNSFDASCTNNLLLGDCVFNNFGKQCTHNNFGTYYKNIIFDNNCSYNEFTCTLASGNETFANYVSNIKFDINVCWVKLNSTSLPSSYDTSKIKNIHVYNGVKGSSTSPKVVDIPNDPSGSIKGYEIKSSDIKNLG